MRDRPEFVGRVNVQATVSPAIAANPRTPCGVPYRWVALWALWGCAGDIAAPDALPAAAVGDEQRSAGPSATPVRFDQVERIAVAHDPVRHPVPETEAQRGNLAVFARYARDGRPAAGLVLRLLPFDAPPGELPRPNWVSPRLLGNSERPGSRLPRRALDRTRVAVDGTAQFRSVPPGRYLLRDDRGGVDVAVRVAPGVDTPVDYPVAAGVQLQGVVVRPDGAAVEGAIIEVWSPDCADEIETVATTDWAGRFRIDDVQPQCSFGVRAEEHYASEELRASAMAVREVRVELQPNACAVDGFVVNQALQPIGEAVVWVGLGRGYGPQGLWARTDARGHFRLFGLECDEYSVLVQADGYERRIAQAIVETPAQFVLQPAIR